jgi:hypothetical protein
MLIIATSPACRPLEYVQDGGTIGFGVPPDRHAVRWGGTRHGALRGDAAAGQPPITA